MKRFASDRVAGLMERLGLEDDVAIESGIVGKTIESAQSRVEGFNFDMRKRVVEFDDVINRQRETIYEERNKVLRNEDLTETVRAFLDDEIRSLVEVHLDGDNVDDWGMEAVVAALRAMGLDGPGTSEDELWEIGNRDGILEHLLELADGKLDAKSAEVGEADWSMVERLVLLRTIDSLWVEHLTEVDDMRRGIGLRGYAQQDPLNEFRREAFQLYGELRDLIRHQLASTIFRVTVTRTPSQEPPPEMVGAVPFGVSAGSSMATSGASGGAGPGGQMGRGAAAGLLGSGSSATGGGGLSGTSRLAPPIAGGLAPDPMAQALRQRGGDGAAADGAKPGFTPTGARIGRNDQCWCGSGQKYKKCHGR
jgi:preprotein translocase subunit SecA